MKVLTMNKEQSELQNQCDKLSQQLRVIKQTKKLLSDVKSMPVVVREELRNDINKLLKCMYE